MLIPETAPTPTAHSFFTMRIEHLTDKGSGTVNEDSYLITPNLYGVFDGVTGLIRYTDTKGNTGGLIASQTAKEAFERNQNKPLLSSVKEILTEIRKKMDDASIGSDKADFWSTSASVVRIKDEVIEYLRIGDSPIVFVDKENKLQTFFVEHDLDTSILWQKLADEEVKNIRSDNRMQDQFFKNRRDTNITYGMLNGEKEAIKFVKTGSVPKGKLKYILIFTDGMLIPKKDPDDVEDFKTIVSLFEKGGLDKVKSYIRNLENSDLDCAKYLRFKPHDDLTAIAITF